MSIKHVCINMGLEIAKIKSIFAETLICVTLPNLQGRGGKFYPYAP